eukprot:TRINITY_DN16298_c0_g1_i2.p2 TRINITY_DN16298_c0_g1~~TRINITY_DN16298_c0_g1_i2.p2  ORF type:complete len:254 (+),score=68.82 TRINITY_DN16298_c0_g1_i2:65-826(+)
MAPTLRLAVVGKGGQLQDVEVDAEATGQDLKEQVRLALDLQAPISSLAVSFQNGSRNAAKVLIADERSLAEQGLEDGVRLTVKDSSLEVAPADSVLRQSIARNGGQSYYYAHANEKDLPPEHRYVYGGEPAKLAQADASCAEAAMEAVPQAIVQFAWADEGDFVCVYVSAEGESEALAAARDGKSGEVEVRFEPRFAELRVKGSSKVYALALRDLEGDIVPEQCKHRVSAGKRITLKLRKAKELKWTRLTRPR